MAEGGAFLQDHPFVWCAGSRPSWRKPHIPTPYTLPLAPCWSRQSVKSHRWKIPHPGRSALRLQRDRPPGPAGSVSSPPLENKNAGPGATSGKNQLPLSTYMPGLSKIWPAQNAPGPPDQLLSCWRLGDQARRAHKMEIKALLRGLAQGCADRLVGAAPGRSVGTEPRPAGPEKAHMPTHRIGNNIELLLV